MAIKKEATPASVVITPTNQALTLNNVQANQSTDTSLAISLHAARQRNANVNIARYNADEAEHNAATAQIKADIAKLGTEIATIRKEVKTVKRDTDAVKAHHQVQIMANSVSLAANRANVSNDTLATARNTSQAKGITLDGTDHKVKFELPDFKV